MRPITRTHPLVYVVLFIFFFIDISIFSFWERPLSHLVMILLIYMLFYHYPLKPLYYAGILHIIESFIYYNCWWLPLTYLIPGAWLAKQINYLFATSFLHPILFLAAYLVIAFHRYKINNLGSYYTFVPCIVILILSVLISLTYRFQGNLGNRA